MLLRKMVLNWSSNLALRYEVIMVSVCVWFMCSEAPTIRNVYARLISSQCSSSGRSQRSGSGSILLLRREWITVENNITVQLYMWPTECLYLLPYEGMCISFLHFPANWMLVSVLPRPSSLNSTMQKYKNENKEMTRKQWKHSHYIWEVFCTCGGHNWLKINEIIPSFSPSATKCTNFTSSVSSFMDDVFWVYTLSCAALVLHHACL